VAAVEVIRANGLEIAYERAGAGPPLVLVHGAGDDSRMWQPQLAALADEFHRRRLGRARRGELLGYSREFGMAAYAHCLGAHRGARARPFGALLTYSRGVKRRSSRDLRLCRRRTQRPSSGRLASWRSRPARVRAGRARPSMRRGR